MRQIFSGSFLLIGITDLDELIYLKSALKCDSCDVTIGIKIPFLRVSVTIEPGRSLLQFVTTNCLILPFSNLMVEPVFSIVKYVATEERNR